MSPRDRLITARVARLATVDTTGAPHLVPIVFALDGERILTPVDHKPKRSPLLKRLANIAAEPRVAVLADHYDDDWSRLWWVRADGVASRLDPGDSLHAPAAALLTERYRQYRDHPLEGPIIEIAVSRWTGWSAAD